MPQPVGRNLPTRGSKRVPPMSRKHKLESRESNCAVGHDELRSSALPRVHRGRCSPFLNPEGHNFFSYCLEPERAILGLADYKFWCEVLVSAFLAMVSGNSFNPKLYGACPGHFTAQSLPRLSVNRYGCDLPYFPRVLGDRAVAGELARSGNVQDDSARPCLRVRV